MASGNKRASIKEIKETDLVNYLSGLGYEPVKIRGNDYWYLSPLRDEKTASFKISRALNRWYDHGLGKGGNIIDFAILYYNCTVGEFLQKIDGNFSFHRNRLIDPHKRELAKGKINVLDDYPITSFALIRYLQQRRVTPDVADHFCREVRYELNNKIYYGIGFKNDSNGYEIRNPYFKGSSSPKDITTIWKGGEEAIVFEGFIDFLSFKTVHQNEAQVAYDFVILNSLSFFERARPFMEEHKSIRLYLDRDTAGQNCSRTALSLNGKYRDESRLYEHHKDFNDWLVNFGKAKKKRWKQKP